MVLVKGGGGRPRWGVWVGQVGSWMVALTAGLSAGAAPEVVPGEVLVKWRGGTRPAVQLQGVRDSRLPAGARVKSGLAQEGWELVVLPPGMGSRAGVDWFRHRRDVTAVEPNVRWKLHRSPNDPDWPRLFGPAAIGAPTAWETTTGSTNIVAAIIDTGIDTTHPDLLPNLWTNAGEIRGNGKDDDGDGVVDDVHGADFRDNDGDPSDDAGHGSHVAGTIGAAGDNGIGVAGVCWKVRLLGVRVGGVDGFADTASLGRAFDYLVRLKRRGVDIRVVNCSWGGGFPSSALKEAIGQAGAAGMVIVCSAGNDRQDNDVMPTYPSGYDLPEVISVAASTGCDAAADFSNYGRLTVDLAAPGAGILSTVPGGDGRYAFFSGTSMASPHVSGAVALLAARRPDLTAAQLKSVLLATVDRLPAWEGKVATGGRLNVARAFESVAGATLPVPREVIEPRGRVVAVTRNAAGGWGDGDTLEPSSSADGRWLAFTSVATNLVGGDTEGFVDVFVADLKSNVVMRVSQTQGGAGGRGDSSTPAISGDGRFVAFMTSATNLIGGEATGTANVVLWDRTTRQLELVSVRADGRGAGNDDSDTPAINGDGSVVAFVSRARDLIGNDRNGERDVYVRDRVRRVTERVSVTNTGAEAAGESEAPSISADGRVVAFHSAARNLVMGDNNASWDTFARDRSAGRTEVVSSKGTPAVIGNSDSVYPVISADGRQVVFSSAASNFDGRNPNGFLVAFVHDRQTREVRRVSGPPPPAVPLSDAYPDGIDAVGRFISFSSDDTGLAPGGAPGLFRQFVWDRLTGEAELVAFNEGGLPSEDNTFYGRLSGDGRYVAFASLGFNLVPGDGNGSYDVFRLDRGESRPDLAVRAGTNGGFVGVSMVHPLRPQRAEIRLASGEEPARYEVRLMNAAGTGGFTVRATTPVPSGWRFSARESSGGTEVSAALLGAGWTTPLIPAGSNLVLRVEVGRVADRGGEAGFGLHLVARAAGSGTDLDAVDLVTSTDLPPPGLELVSRAWDGVPSAKNAEVASVSGDGRFVAFSTEADHLVASGDTNFQSDVFLVDRQTRTLRRMSDASASDQANADSRYPSLSADGGRVAYQSRADNLVTGDSNGVEDVFVQEVGTRVITRASVSATGRQGNHASDSAFLAAGGRFVSFTSFADNLVPGDGNRANDVFVKDLETGAVECVSRSVAGVFGDAESDGGRLSADGRYVLFSSFAGNLSSLDTNAYQDAYLYDRAAGVLELISANTNGVAGNGPSVGSSVSDDGRYVTYSSYGSDMAVGAPFGGSRVYLLDRTTRKRTALTGQVLGLPSGYEVERVGMSADGRMLSVVAGRDCGEVESWSQVFAYDVETREVRWVSAGRGGERGNEDTTRGRFGAGGRFMILETHAANLLGEAARPASQILLADLLSPGLMAAARRGTEGAWRAETEALELPVLSQSVPVGAAGGRQFVIRITNPSAFPQSYVVRGISSRMPGPELSMQAGSGSGPLITAAVFGAEGWRSLPVPRRSELELVVTVIFPAGSDHDLDLELAVSSTADAGRSRTVRLSARPDADLDGLSDSWEVRWFKALTATNGEGDEDGDGLTDREEERAGTSPVDAGEGLRLAIGAQAGRSSVELSWETVRGRYYQVERAEQAGGVYGRSTREDLVGQGGRMRWSDTVGTGAGVGVYRVRVEPP